MHEIDKEKTSCVTAIAFKIMHPDMLYIKTVLL